MQIPHVFFQPLIQAFHQSQQVISLSIQMCLYYQDIIFLSSFTLPNIAGFKDWFIHRPVVNSQKCEAGIFCKRICGSF